MCKQLLLLIVLFVFSSYSAISQSEAVCKNIASEAVDWLGNDESDKLFVHFNETVSKQIDANTTASIWSQIEGQYGEFVSVDTLIMSMVKGTFVIDQNIKYEKALLKFRLSFDADNKISGIFFIPYRTERSGVDQNQYFTEKQCFFVNEGIKFPAMLCSPKNQKAKAVVVLVHGSGPNDMDQTIGPNKILKQIANKLAEHGIASLRYDKRSYLAQQGRLKEALEADINHIVVDDAVAAAEFIRSIDSLSNLPRIIVGHSLGAHMAPEIARRTAGVDAIVMLAANARPLEDLILEQYKYLYKRDGYTSAEKKDIRDIKKKVKRVKKIDKYLAKGISPKLPLTNDTTFWKSVHHYNALKTIQNINKPILIIQGGRDYQVTKTDFDLWYNNLENSVYKDQSFIYYSNLNHLFIKGNEASYPEEYNEKAEISDNMIKDMADWIKNIYSTESIEPKLKTGFIHSRKG